MNFARQVNNGVNEKGAKLIALRLRECGKFSLVPADFFAESSDAEEGKT